MRGFGAGATPVAFGAAVGTVPLPMTPTFGMLAPPPYNTLVDVSDELSPLVVGQVLGTAVAVATNHRESRVRAVSGYSGMVQHSVSGFWSDPAIACTNMKCVAVVSDTNAGFARFVFNGGTVVGDTFSLGAVTSMRMVGPTNRPAIVAVDSDRFIMVARTTSMSGTAELTLLDFDTRTSPPSLRGQSSLALTAPLTPGTPIVASSVGGSMMFAFSTTTGPSMIQSVNVSAVGVNPSLGTPSPPAAVVRRFASIRTFDLARNATTYVLSWQEPGGLFRMPIQIVPLGSGEYGVAYRAAVSMDEVAGTSVVRAHRMASGPKPLLVYEELTASAGAPSPRALGYVLDVCRGPSDCELTLGAGWMGTCDVGVCRRVNTMDGGVPDAMTADATADVRDVATMRDGDATTDGPMDGAMGRDAMGRDAIAPEDAEAPDAADVLAMDSAAMDSAAMDSAAMDSASDGAFVVDAAPAVDGASATDATSPTGVPVITGGACGCRAAGRSRSALGACSIVLALCVVGARRRRASTR